MICSIRQRIGFERNGNTGTKLQFLELAFLFFGGTLTRTNTRPSHRIFPLTCLRQHTPTHQHDAITAPPSTTTAFAQKALLTHSIPPCTNKRCHVSSHLLFPTRLVHNYTAAPVQRRQGRDYYRRHWQVHCHPRRRSLLRFNKMLSLKVSVEP